jgi:hypothetical protein
MGKFAKDKFASPLTKNRIRKLLKTFRRKKGKFPVGGR